MVKMIVACLGDAATRFDRAYYVDRHLPLARSRWEPHGLERAEAFFPTGSGDGWVTLGVYRFRDRAALDSALASPETARVMADVPRFTDAVVVRNVFPPSDGRLGGPGTERPALVLRAGAKRLR